MSRAVIVVSSPPPPSLNRQERMHWAARKRLRDRWRRMVRVAWLAAGRPKFRRPRIAVRFFYPGRRPDPDNAVAAVKPILDALKGYAWPGDDDAGSIELGPVELYVDRNRPRVEIVLEECPGARVKEIRRAAEGMGS